MSRRAAIAVGALALIAAMDAAHAATREASIGNYYYEDDATRSRSQIVVVQGDQVRFTVREGVYPPHTVDIDELNIHSPGLLLGETFTTPPINRAGTFRVYCRPHEDRGHVTQLVVRAPITASTAPPAVQPAPSATVGGVSTPAASATPTVSLAPTLAPVGVGRATEQSLARPQAADPDSLEGLTGRARSTQPWTRALWFLLIATVPIVGAAAFALQQERVRARDTTRSLRDRQRSPERSRRSSAPKASGSGRRSNGRRR